MPESPFSWITLFLVTCYLMGFACLYRGFRIGCLQGSTKGLREIGLFLLFCGLGYSVESWAQARTPYYCYAREFPDRVARIPSERLSWFPPPPENTPGSPWLTAGSVAALLVVYNRWGKLCPIPPLTDALQGIAWPSLPEETP